MCRRKSAIRSSLGTKLFRIRPTGKTDEDYIAVRIRDVDSVRSLLYFAANDTLGRAPTGNIDPVPHVFEEVKGFTLIRAPEGHWPSDSEELNTRLPWRLTLHRNYKLVPNRDAEIKQAIILMTRQFFEQPEVYESNFAVNALIDTIVGQRLSDYY